MSALAALTLNDGQATPVAHTFSPARITDRGVAKYYDRLGGVPVLFSEVHIAVYDPPTITNKVKAGMVDKLMYKAVLKVLVPVPDVTSPATGTGIQPAPSKAYDCAFSCTFSLPVRSDLSTRKDVLAYVKGLLATTEVSNAVLNLEGVY
jgi:hypothetical protein